VVAPGGEAVAVSINAGFPPVAVALSDDGALLAVATRDLATPEPPPGTPGWQIPPGGPLYRFDVAGEAVTLRDTLALPGVVVAMSFSAGGDLMLAGTTAGQVGLVPRVPSEMEDHLRPAGVDDYAHEGAVRALALSPDARRALTAGDAPGGLELKMWDLERRAVLGTLTAPGQAVSLDLAPDGRAVAIGTTHGGVHVRVVGDDAR
ncbi:MAG: hypothetical protein KIT58_17640, partial [Planctomycetota bacterium]|nr:hypothetical protein [Planctomycetota bacterium]